ncbi:MAG: hypothetical protein GY953_52915, partial [bacterium]|nr:hypothetical protein [bacterium]
DRLAWWIASTVVMIIAALGLLDLKNNSYSGFLANGGTAVTQVREDSPAAWAGFQVGDRIVNNAGIDTEDVYALFRQPRAEIGETRRYVVEREGVAKPLVLSVTFTELPARLKGLTLGAALIGLVFLVCGLSAYFRHPSRSSRLLAFLGVSAMLVFIALPYIPRATPRLIATLLPVVATTLMPALLLHFLLRFPRRRAFLDRKISGWLIYGPVAVVGVVAAVTLLVRPQLLSLAIAVATAVPVLHLLFAIGVLIHSYVKADAAARIAHGLHVLLAGFILGLVPMLVGGFVSALPGSRFYFLTTILIPLSLAYCVFRVEGHRQVELQPQLS